MLQIKENLHDLKEWQLKFLEQEKETFLFKVIYFIYSKYTLNKVYIFLKSNIPIYFIYISSVQSVFELHLASV